jgi:hypothetical protein
MTETG